MAKITYVGRHTAGIYLPGDVLVAHGATIDVSAELADELVARGDFKAASKKSDTTATPEES